MTPLRALIFDMDGVLIDNLPLHVKAWEIFFQRHRISFDSGLLMKQFFGRGNRDILMAALPPQFADRDPEILSHEKESLFREIAQRELKPLAGLCEFLEFAKRAGLKMCVASSAPKANVEFVAKHLDIAHYFETLIDDSCASQTKPAPDLFLLAARRLNVSPAECIVFEDSRFGVAAACAAAMDCVALLTQHGPGELSPVIFEIADFTDARVRKLAEDRM